MKGSFSSGLGMGIGAHIQLGPKLPNGAHGQHLEPKADTYRVYGCSGCKIAASVIAVSHYLE